MSKKEYPSRLVSQTPKGFLALSRKFTYMAKPRRETRLFYYNLIYR